MPLNLILIYYFNFCHQEKNGKKIVLKKKNKCSFSHDIENDNSILTENKIKNKLKIRT
jgi:hypothetical protein